MKCARCGAELKDGYLYCSVCGYESKIEADMTTFEDEYFKTILEGSDNKTQPDTKAHRTKKAVKDVKMNLDKRIIVAIAAVVVAVLGVCISVISVRNKNANSYDYQMAKAEECMTEGRYQDALGFYQNALTLMPADVNARLAMADIYKADGEYDAALVFYMDVLSVDSNNIEAYSNLIDIYDKREDYKSIKSLMANATSAAALALFDDYVVETPTLSPSVGVYDDYIEIVPFSVEGYDVYYTMDGSDPTAGKGILYDDTTQIDLDENGTYEIAVACKNQKGIFSDVATGTYVIDVKPPEYAIVSPDGGHVDADTLITITAENGCSIYYTWDDTDPTDASERYAEPIAVPEGNNVLSVIAVNDSTGMSSGIYRTNFVVE